LSSLDPFFPCVLVPLVYWQFAEIMRTFVRLPGIFAPIRAFFTRFQSTVHGQHVCGKVNGKRDVFQLAAERWRFVSLAVSVLEKTSVGSDRIGSERNGKDSTDRIVCLRCQRAVEFARRHPTWFMLLCVAFSNVKIKLLQYVCAKRLLKHFRINVNRARSANQVIVE